MYNYYIYLNVHIYIIAILCCNTVAVLYMWYVMMMETDLRDEECICWACPLYSGYSKWFPVSYLQIDNVEIALLLVDTVTKRAY